MARQPVHDHLRFGAALAARFQTARPTALQWCFMAAPAQETEPAEERILQATMDALAQLDPAAVTIKRICQTAGVTAPTIYYHFGNKDGLLAAAVERLVTDWLSAIDAVVSRDATLDEAIALTIGVWQAAIVSPARPLAVFTWATLLLSGTSELARNALIAARDRGRAMIVELLGLHVQPPGVVDMVAGLAVDTVIAAAVQYELDHDRQALDARLQNLGLAVRMVAAGG